MTGKELIKKIKQTSFTDCEISINFSLNGNGCYVAEIKNVSVECTDLNLFIDIGKIDDIINHSSLQDNSKLVDNMCISYRHDFGLMDEENRQLLRFQCKEWLRAYENNRKYCC